LEGYRGEKRVERLRKPVNATGWAWKLEPMWSSPIAKALKGKKKFMRAFHMMRVTGSADVSGRATSVVSQLLSSVNAQDCNVGFGRQSN
jgi:hypothetical protein